MFKTNISMIIGCVLIIETLERSLLVFLTPIGYLNCTHQNDIVSQRFFGQWYERVINRLENVVNAFGQQQPQFHEDAGPFHFIHFIGPVREKMTYIERSKRLLY